MANEGSWTVLRRQDGTDLSAEVLAVHAALLPTGAVLIFSGDETEREFHNRLAYDHSRLFLPETATIVRIGSPTTDVFCCGHTALADGRVLVAGGIPDGDVGDFFLAGVGIHAHHAPGSRACWGFDPLNRTWTRLQDQNAGPLEPNENRTDETGGRWYPTAITLGNGEVLLVSGHPGRTDARHHNNTPEVLPSEARPADGWHVLPPSGSDNLDPAHTYPRLHQLPNGLVFSVTPFDGSGRSCLLDAVTGDLRLLDAVPTDGGDPPPAPLEKRIYAGYHCTSVLLPLLPNRGYRPRVLIAGGRQSHVIDLADAQPRWTTTATRELAGTPSRWNATAVLLPTGEVGVFGGVSLTVGPQGEQLFDANAVRVAELFNPETSLWSQLAGAAVTRNYHSVALLLPDGRVFTGGSNENTFLGANFVEMRIEMFSPWYCERPRPAIVDCPAIILPGQRFTVRVAASATGAPVERVAILRTGSVTHGYNGDQRYVGLEFNVESPGTLSVVAPPDTNIAPPGTYLLFALDTDGVPSPGVFVRIPAPAHWTRFFWLSKPELVRRGTDVAAVSSVPGGVSLFVVDRDGAVQSSYYDPRVPQPRWTDWFRLGEPGKVAVDTHVAAVSSVPGGVSLFVVDRDFAVQSTYYDPRVANPQWADWFRLSGAGKAAAGTSIAAVSSVPGGVSLFVIDRDGARCKAPTSIRVSPIRTGRTGSALATPARPRRARTSRR
jgi:hypothetical protein